LCVLEKNKCLIFSKKSSGAILPRELAAQKPKKPGTVSTYSPELQASAV
jgi:hypothetical protein